MTRSQINRLFLICSGLLSFLHPLNSKAEDESDYLIEEADSEYIDEEPETLEVFVRGSTRADDYDDVTSTAIVESVDVREGSAPSLTDAVRGAPGVSVQQTTPGQGTVYVRGLSGRAIGHTIDGVRLNTAFYRAGNNPYLGLVDPYALARITVVSGAAAVEYGGDALGGAVLMTTPLPGYYHGGTSTKVHVFQSISSTPLASISHADVTYMSETLSGNAGLTYIRAGDIRPGESEKTPDPSSYWGLKRNPGSDYQPEESSKQQGTGFDFIAGHLTVQKKLKRFELVGRGQLSYRPELNRYDQVTPRFKREYPRRSEASVSPMDREMVSMELNHRPLNSWYRSSKLMFAWQRIAESPVKRGLDEVCLEEDVASDTDPETCTDTLQLLPSSSRTTERNSSNAFTSLYSSHVPLSDAWDLRAGVEGHWDIVGSKSETLDIETHRVEAGSPRYPGGSSTGEGGLFAKTTYAKDDLSAYFGARAMAFLLDINSRKGSLETPVFQKGLFDYALNAGVRWQFARPAALVTNLGRGVRMPNVADFAGLGPRAKGRYQVPNNSLGAEHSYTADAGIKFKRGDAP